jgi:lipopolysaccharide assembly outer membrane protein LptD (OstA)|tara:strand:+ start:1189 stop:1764 length:576 start_codon:yes stop_codon:yes gene_type:complete
MNKAKIIKVLIFSFLLISILIVIKSIQKPPIIKKIDKVDETTIDSGKSNVINEVSYQSQDINGNKYLINALKGEIDLSNSDTIFLTNVSAQIDLKNSNSILISSDFGKYNIKNFDTIFSKNVTIFYLNSKIIGDYLDFSIDRSSMVISRNVVYTNNKNILKTDVVEVDIKTKDIKIFMYDEKKKVNIQNIK